MTGTTEVLRQMITDMMVELVGLHGEKRDARIADLALAIGKAIKEDRVRLDDLSERVSQLEGTRRLPPFAKAPLDQ